MVLGNYTLIENRFRYQPHSSQKLMYKTAIIKKCLYTFWSKIALRDLRLKNKLTGQPDGAT